MQQKLSFLSHKFFKIFLILFYYKNVYWFVLIFFQLLVYKWTRKAKEIKPEITDDLAVALEMVVESMPVKNLNQISFNVPEEAEASMDQFLLRAFYGEEKKPKFPIVFVYNEGKWLNLI